MSPDALRRVRDRVASSIDPAGPPPLANKHPDGDYGAAAPRARLSCGFFPWASPDLHGRAGSGGTATALNHEGMGGSMAYADPETGLAICVLKNVYEPLSVLSGSISPDACEIAAQIRQELGIE